MGDGIIFIFFPLRTQPQIQLISLPPLTDLVYDCIDRSSSMWVLVTEILDTFGDLVFQRLRDRSERTALLAEQKGNQDREDDNGGPNNGKGRRGRKASLQLSAVFTSDEVTEEARETCRNWFYKTAGIRQLLPRLYIEMALARCYRFLCDGDVEKEMKQIFRRMADSMRGVGNPLVAIYARAYLARVGLCVLRTMSARSFIPASFCDYAFAFQQYKDGHSLLTTGKEGETESSAPETGCPLNATAGPLSCMLQENSMSIGDYLELHSPAVEWLLWCAAGAVVRGEDGSVAGSEEEERRLKETFTLVLRHYRDYCQNGMVLRHIIASFPVRLYIRSLSQVVSLVSKNEKEKNGSCFHVAEIYAELALGLSRSHVWPSERQKAALLSETWKSVTRLGPSLSDFTIYCRTLLAYVHLVLRHYSPRELLILLRDLSRHSRGAKKKWESTMEALEDESDEHRRRRKRSIKGGEDSRDGSSNMKEKVKDEHKEKRKKMELPPDPLVAVSPILQDILAAIISHYQARMVVGVNTNTTLVTGVLGCGGGGSSRSRSRSKSHDGARSHHDEGLEERRRALREFLRLLTSDHFSKLLDDVHGGGGSAASPQWESGGGGIGGSVLQV